MINTKLIYNSLLNNETITGLVPDTNIFNSYPNEIETFPCIVFIDENQSDGEYSDNKSKASNCSVEIDIFTKKLDGYVTSSEIGIAVAKVMNNDLWNCSQNREVSDPDPDCEHRVMFFNKSIFNVMEE